MRFSYSETLEGQTIAVIAACIEISTFIPLTLPVTKRAVKTARSIDKRNAKCGTCGVYSFKGKVSYLTLN